MNSLDGLACAWLSVQTRTMMFLLYLLNWVYFNPCVFLLWFTPQPTRVKWVRGCVGLNYHLGFKHKSVESIFQPYRIRYWFLVFMIFFPRDFTTHLSWFFNMKELSHNKSNGFFRVLSWEVLCWHQILCNFVEYLSMSEETLKYGLFV